MLTVVAAAGITGATAVVVGLLAYLGARLAARSTVAQVEAERDRHREEMIRQVIDVRRAMYHDFLVAERRIYPVVHGDEPTIAGMRDWVFTLNEHLAKLLVGAPENVAGVATQLHNACGDMYQGALALHEDENDTEPFSHAITRWRTVRRSLIDEMRRDAAPDERAFDWPALPDAPM